MKQAISEIIDVINNHKGQPGAILFIQEVKQVLAKHAKEPQINKQLTELVRQLQSDPANADFAQAIENATNGTVTKSKKTKSIVLNPEMFNRKKEVPRPVKHAGNEVKENTEREDQSISKSQEELFEIYTKGKDVVQEEIKLEDFIAKLPEEIKLGENPTYDEVWNAFEKHIRSFLKA